MNFFPENSEPDPETSDPVDNNRFYSLLELDKSASSAEVKKAFRKIAMKKHPDKGGDPAEFAEISHAAEVLSDPEKRKVYDRYGEKGINEHREREEEGVSIFDLLNGHLPEGGRKPKNEQKCEPTLVPLSVSLSELYNGTVKSIPITRTRVCSGCNGEGGTKTQMCEDCKGQGGVLQMVEFAPGMYTQTIVQCDACGGQGQVIDLEFQCKVCLGKRVSTEEKTVLVDVEKGAPNGHQYTFSGEGDEEPGFQAGDLLVEIQEEEHDFFKRKKADLIIRKKITLSEALTGYRFTLKHLDDSLHLIESIPGEMTQPEDVKTVEDLGMPVFHLTYKSGNLFIFFEVDFPPPQYFNDASASQLRDLMPGVPGLEVDEEGLGQEFKHMTHTFEDSHVTEDETRTYSDPAHDSDEEEASRSGQAMRCSGTLF